MQRAWHQKLETDWTPLDDSSGSKFEAVVADVSDPVTPDHSRYIFFFVFLFAICIDYDVSWWVNQTFLE